MPCIHAVISQASKAHLIHTAAQRKLSVGELIREALQARYGLQFAAPVPPARKGHWQLRLIEYLRTGAKTWPQIRSHFEGITERAPERLRVAIRSLSDRGLITERDGRFRLK